MPTLSICPACKEHGNAIGTVLGSAFPPEEEPAIRQLAGALLEHPSEPATLNYVAMQGDAIVGYIAFSPLWRAKEGDCSAYLLSPLGVSPDHQGEGIGSALIRHGLEALRHRGINQVFVYGDPAYYGRFGFDAKAAEPFSAPHPLAMPFGWQLYSLHSKGDTATGGALSCVAALDDPALW